jgi:hypothetical protein
MQTQPIVEKHTPTSDPAAQSEVAKQQVEDVKAATDLFTPARILPVAIDYFTDAANPYELSQDVTYDNGVVKVLLEKGFKWDGASIPAWLPVVPWVVTLLAMHFYQTPWLWIATAIFVLYTIRLLPYMQKMGLHARAACVHDKLYRAQKVARVVADAIMDSVMESDGVPRDVRWIIYGRIRHFGWLAWRRNHLALRAKAAAAQQVQVVPTNQQEN